MNQRCQTAVLMGGAAVLFSLASSVLSAATQLATPANASGANAIASTVHPGTSPLHSTTVSTALIAQVPGLLSPDQKAKLIRLPIPIVAPTYLPAGFRLVRAEGETNKYANGDDDSGYAIDYQGEDNTCLSVRSSQDGPRGLPKVGQVQTRFGLVAVYRETFHDNKSLMSFLGIKGNPILISGGTLPDGTANGRWKRCRSVSLETYMKVLKSLTVVK